MKVIKNFLPSDLIAFLHRHYLTLPHFYGHKSIEEGIPFYNHELNPQDPLTNYLCLKVKEAISKEESLSFLRVYFNVQHVGMDGSFHEDDGDNTILLMISDTSPDGGCFEYIEDKKIKQIPFVQNTLIMFNTKFSHRGRSPKKGVRITLAFKTKKGV
tara:strand:- start:78 stop:548 length:471 start_codon:yes stop_codon:yes gene_type:complete